MASAAQLRALHTLYRVHASRSLDIGDGDPRAERLAWASKTIGRTISSFSDLSDGEAATLIDMLKGSIGQSVNRARWTRPRDRHLAHAFATHGRQDRSGNDEVLASAGDLAAIDSMRERLGWTREQFEHWLAGPNSPLLPNSGITLRTWSQVNRVRWALKAMLKKANLWRPSAKRVRRAA